MSPSSQKLDDISCSLFSTGAWKSPGTAISQFLSKSCSCCDGISDPNSSIVDLFPAVSKAPCLRKARESTTAGALNGARAALVASTTSGGLKVYRSVDTRSQLTEGQTGQWLDPGLRLASALEYAAVLNAAVVLIEPRKDVDEKFEDRPLLCSGSMSNNDSPVMLVNSWTEAWLGLMLLLSCWCWAYHSIYRNTWTSQLLYLCIFQFEIFIEHKRYQRSQIFSLGTLRFFNCRLCFFRNRRRIDRSDGIAE